jgi:predicted ATPase/class 3 adenylate cyclase
MRTAPVETLTFLYTDVEGSTRLWQSRPDVMPTVMARHDQLLRLIVEAHGGAVFRTMGDAVCAAFHTSAGGLAAALDGQRAVLAEPWADGITLRVRMALHAGTAEKRAGDYGGHTLNRVARLLAAGHGGQILLSDTVRDLVLDDLPAGVTLRDLGEHRLKDLERPERIVQVESPDLPADFPPLRTLDTMPTNLPAQTTSFIGREREIEAIAAFLRRADIRLLTLLGPGGTGKTRLALQVGLTLLEEYKDGVFFVPLAPIRDSRMVGAAIASALRISEVDNRPIEKTLADAIRDREMLLIVDNVEHVLDAAPLLSSLLTAAPRLTILATSRSVLHLTGEHVYPVPPLAIPDADDADDVERLARYDAVALFVQRARAVKPDFALTGANAPAVTAICRRLDGLPLAIELAAARIRLFPPEALLRRLSSRLTVLTGGSQDAPDRQQTLRGTIDWSYSLLSPVEQRLFSRLAIFVGGWSFEAAEEICSLDGDLDVLSGMAALADQSLVQQEGEAEPRFAMLETIREYAWEIFEASNDAEALPRRHAQWYVALLREAPDFSAGMATILRVLPLFLREQDNLRSALTWSLKAEDWTLFAGIVRPMSMFWFGQGKWAEALSWTEAALAVMPADPTAERAAILFSSGFFFHRTAQDELTVSRLEEAVSIWRGLGSHDRELSAALYALGEHFAWSGNRAEAQRCFEEALSVGRAADSDSVPMVLTSLGILAREDDDFSAARAYTEEALATARRIEHRVYSTVALNSLGDLARLQGDYERAGALYTEATMQSEFAGMTAPRAGLIHNLAYVAHHLGNEDRAREQFIEALNLYGERGDRRGMAECVAGLAVLAADRDPFHAAQMLAAATVAAEALGSHLSSSNQGEYDRALSSIHTHLDTDGFQKAWEKGRAMTLEDAVACAIDYSSSGGVEMHSR